MPPIVETSSKSISTAKLALSIRQLRAETQGIGLLESEPLAIIGMSCRFPGGAESPQEFWQNLIEGRESIREMPESRWKPDPLLSPLLRKGGYLEEVDAFDAAFFGITSREAAYIDPQHRLMLEMTWNALHDAGIPPEQLSGTATGVWAALSSTDYFRMQLRDVSQLGSYVGMGAAHCLASGQISFLLNLHGPNSVVDTACSSSLVAVHSACQSLRNRECGMAIVTASNLKLLPDEVIVYAKLGMLASDGRTKAFDEGADGLVPGEGSGAVILKRFADALADGNRIRAVIRGTAINHNGRTTVLSAPSGLAQQQVMESALRNARVSAEDVTYIETHGTGTSLGDPIEVEALRAVYDKRDGQSCLLGAVKTNIGHLEAAAGMAGLIKVILALEHSEIPANLNGNQLNSRIDLQGSRFRLPRQNTIWARGSRPRLAGISSFGISGTNAHLVIEEPPAQSVRKVDDRAANILVISANCAEALKTSAERHAVLLRKGAASTDAACASAAIHRSHLSHRLAVVGSSAEELASCLEAFASGTERESIHKGICNPSDPARLAFLYSAQDAISDLSVFDLIEQHPVALAIVDAIDAIFAPLAGWSIRKTLQSEDLGERLKSRQTAEPILFAAQASLTALLIARGIVPAAVTGSGIGELAAAHASGILTLEDAARILCCDSFSTDELAGSLKANATDTRHVDFVSSETGEAVDASRFDFRQWSEEGKRPIPFQQAIDSLIARGYTSFVEIGMRPVLSDSIRSRSESQRFAEESCSPTVEVPSGERALANLVGALYVEGAPINWRALYPGQVPVASLPAYPWQRKRLWFDESPSDGVDSDLGETLRTGNPAERHRVIEDYVETCVRRVMALDPSRTIRHDQPLQAIGMDSMMAVMLRNMLQVSTDLQLPSSFAFQHPTIASIAQFLETMLWSEDRAAPGNAPDSIREEIRL